MAKDIHAKLIGFFREFYESDNRGTSITNVFSKKINERFFLKEERLQILLNGELLDLNPKEMRLGSLSLEFRYFCGNASGRFKCEN